MGLHILFRYPGSCERRTRTKEVFAGNLGELFEYDGNGVQSGLYGTSDREAYEIIGDFIRARANSLHLFLIMMSSSDK